MAKYSYHYTKLKATYYIATKGKALTTLVKFVQDLLMLLGLRPQHLQTDSGGEFIADYDDYCKVTAIIQHFSSPNTWEKMASANGTGARS